MKLHLLNLTMCASAMLGLLASTSQAADHELDNDGLGSLKLGQTAAQVTDLLGAPKSKGKDQLWEAIGEWVQDWEFPAHGLTVAMASTSKSGAKTIHSLTAKQGCTLSTARGIKVGSPEEDVRTAYKNAEDKEQSKKGETFVAGSVYGGVIFTFKNGKVSEIFVGAAAE
ncbi:MAG: hypothetical protein JNM99_24625 [Verrucomicrobiaceae bacterium]|nr:hypothetical protein [Verrucomicrobiaceae bacterium]